MALHGALLGHELHALGIDPWSDPRVQRMESPFGPLYTPNTRKHVHTKERGHHQSGRTVGAATDGAYLRLFIRRTPGQWRVDHPHQLGIFLADLSKMPEVTVNGQTHIVSGKVYGGGVTVLPLGRHISKHKYALMRQNQRLMVVVPEMTRYDSMQERHKALVTFVVYSVDDARRDNLNAHPGGDT